MSLIVGRTNEVGLPIEGWNGEHLVSFKLGTSDKKGKAEGEKEGEMLLSLTFSDGTKADLKGSEAHVFYEKVIVKNFQVSLTAVQLGSANKMLNTLQNQVGVARKKAEKEAETAKKPDTNFRRMM